MLLNLTHIKSCTSIFLNINLLSNGEGLLLFIYIYFFFINHAFINVGLFYFTFECVKYYVLSKCYESLEFVSL